MTSGLNEIGEHDHNAMINSLLVRLDDHDGFIIAATNHPDSIDPAVWRRFDIQIALEAPGQVERERILARYLTPFGLPKRALVALAEAFATGSPALMRQFAEGLKRQTIVGPAAGWDMGRDAVLTRLLASIEPQTSKPRLWAHRTDDHAVKIMPWPLPKASDIGHEAEPEIAAVAATPGAKVVAFGPRGAEAGQGS